MRQEGQPKGLNPEELRMIAKIVGNVEEDIQERLVIFKKLTNIKILSEILDQLSHTSGKIPPNYQEKTGFDYSHPVVVFAAKPDAPAATLDQIFGKPQPHREDPRNIPAIKSLGAQLTRILMRQAAKSDLINFRPEAFVLGLTAAEILTDSLSVFGGDLFSSLQTFDPDSQLAGHQLADLQIIDLRSIRLPVLLVGDIAAPPGVLGDIVGLAEIDEFRIQHLKIAAAEAREMPGMREPMQVLLSGVRTDRIFPPPAAK